jgi:hypothetical protein
VFDVAEIDALAARIEVRFVPGADAPAAEVAGAP